MAINTLPIAELNPRQAASVLTALVAGGQAPAALRVWGDSNIAGLNAASQSGDGADYTAAGVWFAGSSAVPGKGAGDLRGSVTGLVEALSSYTHTAPACTGGALAQGGAGGGRIDMAACVAQMADNLASFGLGKTGPARPGQAAMAGPGEGLRLPGWHDGLTVRAQGWLAAVQ
ncbi:hypothetical protein LJR289_004659 [Pseudoduganella sp. LjRoot289]|uniref:hypothetical protein n=1 Tax=Pseudoduganella sp. LjRoot289 TaxID=3342314 RepID=UPI003ECE0A1A